MTQGNGLMCVYVAMIVPPDKNRGRVCFTHNGKELNIGIGIERKLSVDVKFSIVFDIKHDDSPSLQHDEKNSS